MARHMTLPRLIVCVALCGLVATCGDPATSDPARPSGPVLTNLEIVGPDSIAPGGSAQFVAYARLSDGSRKAATPDSGIRWRSSNGSVTVNATTGSAAAVSATGESFLTVNVGSRQATKEVVILPAGTFRLVGRVLDDEFPSTSVPSARVEVVSGSASTIADTDGRYRLYGVPPDADVQITASGYQPVVQSMQLSKNTSRDFRLTPSGPRPTLAGAYVLDVDVTGSCAAMPPEYQHRRYDAQIGQTGVNLDVRLTEPRFKIGPGPRGNQFNGIARPGGATFDVPNDFYDYYGFFTYGYPNMVEQLADGSFLVVSGRVVANGSSAGFSGPMTEGNGLIRYDSRFPSFAKYLGGCDVRSAITFTFTPR